MPNKDPDKQAKQAVKNTRKKRQRWDAVANALGYPSHYSMLTAMKNAYELGKLGWWLDDKSEYYQEFGDEQ